MFAMLIGVDPVNFSVIAPVLLLVNVALANVVAMGLGVVIPKLRVLTVHAPLSLAIVNTALLVLVVVLAELTVVAPLTVNWVIFTFTVVVNKLPEKAPGVVVSPIIKLAQLMVPVPVIKQLTFDPLWWFCCNALVTVKVPFTVMVGDGSSEKVRLLQIIFSPAFITGYLAGGIRLNTVGPIIISSVFTGNAGEKILGGDQLPLLVQSVLVPPVHI